MAEASRPSKKRAVLALGSLGEGFVENPVPLTRLRTEGSAGSPSGAEETDSVPVPTNEARNLCAAEAFKYETREQFRSESPEMYELARSSGWLDVVCSHMSQGQWESKEACRSESLKYHTRHQFMKGNYTAYNTAKRNEWLDEICQHMPFPTKQVPSGFWNSKENCRAEALKHGSKSQFLKECKNAYNASVRHGWIDEVRLGLRTRRSSFASTDMLPYATRTLG